MDFNRATSLAIIKHNRPSSKAAAKSGRSRDRLSSKKGVKDREESLDEEEPTTSEKEESAEEDETSGEDSEEKETDEELVAPRRRRRSSLPSLGSGDDDDLSDQVGKETFSSSFFTDNTLDDNTQPAKSDPNTAPSDEFIGVFLGEDGRGLYSHVQSQEQAKALAGFRKRYLNTGLINAKAPIVTPNVWDSAAEHVMKTKGAASIAKMKADDATAAAAMTAALKPIADQLDVLARLMPAIRAFFDPMNELINTLEEYETNTDKVSDLLVGKYSVASPLAN